MWFAGKCAGLCAGDKKTDETDRGNDSNSSCLPWALRHDALSCETRCEMMSRLLLLAGGLSLAGSLLLPAVASARGCGAPPRARRRHAAPPRCAESAPDDEHLADPMGGPLDDTFEGVGDIEYVRPPPEYPEGLHEAAKADRTGPYWSSLGEPDSTTGVRPPYLRRDDWHISSTYTAEERARIAAEEQAVIDSVVIEMPDDDEDDEKTYEELFGNKEYMELEDVTHTGETATASVELPNTWQAYQALQGQIGALATAEGLPASVRDEAAALEPKLADFYETFREILKEGWKLENAPDVEVAVKFALKHDPPREDASVREVDSSEVLSEVFAA